MWKILGILLLSVPSLGGTKCPPVSTQTPAIAKPPKGTSPFYEKYIDAQGMPILASGKVCDRSLQVVYETVIPMLRLRPDILKTLNAQKATIAIFGVDEKMTDLPEDRDLAGRWIDAAHTRKFDDTCGGGGVPGRPTSVCEKNLIGIRDPYFGKMSVLIHEFGHTIQNLGLNRKTAAGIARTYQNARRAKLFPRADGSVSNMMTNVMEFFAEATGIWFGAADPTNPANSPEETDRKHLKTYAPELYEILREIYPDDDWPYPRA